MLLGIKELLFIFGVAWLGVVYHEVTKLPVLLGVANIWAFVFILSKEKDKEASRSKLLLALLVLLLTCFIYEPLVLIPQYEHYKAHASDHFSLDPNVAREAYYRMRLMQISCIPEVLVAFYFLYTLFPSWCRERAREAKLALKRNPRRILRYFIVLCLILLIEELGWGPRNVVLIGGSANYLLQYALERKLDFPIRSVVFFTLLYLDVRYIIPEISKTSEELFLLNQELANGGDREVIADKSLELLQRSAPYQLANFAYICGFLLWTHVAIRKAAAHAKDDTSSTELHAAT